MLKVNVHEAKIRFSRLLRRVAAGEEITIANRGVPVGRLVPVPAGGTTRKLGFFSGRMTIPGDFDAPLPADILDAVEGKVPRTQTKGKTKLSSRSKSTPRQ
jgi:prevent-host-death family protein